MKHIKVDFKLEVDQDDFPPIAVETLNGTLLDNGLVRIDNVPFFVEDIAIGDLVQCDKAPNCEHYQFSSVVDEGPNKSISIILIDDSVKEGLYQTLKKFGCYCEYGEFQHFNMFAVNCGETVNFVELQSYLMESELNGKISYAELCI